MASPPPAAEMPKKVTFRFCRECSNMLYPKEDTESRTLMFACRTCQFSEPAVTTCIYRNELTNTVGDTAGITQDVGSDPTVGDNLPDFCTMCGQEIFCAICGQECVDGLCLEINEEGDVLDFDEEDITSDESDNGDDTMHTSGGEEEYKDAS